VPHIAESTTVKVELGRILLAIPRRISVFPPEIACSRCRGKKNVSSELFPSNGCCTIACLQICYLAMGLHVTISKQGRLWEDLGSSEDEQLSDTFCLVSTSVHTQQCASPQCVS
jgi:hypothetical protein